MIIMASTEDELEQIRLLLAAQLAANSSKGRVEVTGCQKIVSASTPVVVQLNSSYYHNILIKLSSATSTDTNVYIAVRTLQTQNLATYYLNTTTTKLLLKGVKASSISTDSTLTSGQALYVYFIGYDTPEKIEIDSN